MIKDAYAEATEASINTLMIVEVRVLKELLQLGYVFKKKKKQQISWAFSRHLAGVLPDQSGNKGIKGDAFILSWLDRDQVRRSGSQPECC